jgi:hypothetical protein
MLRHHPNGTGTNFRRKSVRRLACHRPYFSRVGVSGQAGAVQGVVNPLVNDYGFAVEKAAAQQDLLNAAKEAGLIKDAKMTSATPELAKQIDTLASSYANAHVAAEKLDESQDRVRQSAEEMRDFQKDLTRGIVDGFREGKDAADVFADALSKISDRLLDVAFNSVFDSPSKGGSGFDLLGALGGLFREKGGPVKKGQPYIVGERRPEVFVPGQSGTILPKVPSAPSLPDMSKMARGRAAANMTIDASTHIQASGNRETDAELMRWAAKRDAELPGTIIRVVKDAQKRRTI